MVLVLPGQSEKDKFVVVWFDKTGSNRDPNTDQLYCNSSAGTRWWGNREARLGKAIRLNWNGQSAIPPSSYFLYCWHHP